MAATPDSAPTITDELDDRATRRLWDADPQRLWATHVLICRDCGFLSVHAPAGAKRDILDDGLPVAEQCPHCDTSTRHYSTKALREKQHD